MKKIEHAEFKLLSKQKSLDILNNDAGSTIGFYSPHSQMNANSFLDLPFNSIGKYAFNALNWDSLMGDARIEEMSIKM